MIKRLKLTEEHLKLISLIRFKNHEENVEIDKTYPYCVGDRLQDLAFALGYKDYAIPGTEEDPEGCAYPDEIEEKILSIHHYIVDHLYDIEVLIHEMASHGGLVPGTYKCIDREEIWSLEEKEDNEK
jgi:hypothetical protein